MKIRTTLFLLITLLGFYACQEQSNEPGQHSPTPKAKFTVLTSENDAIVSDELTIYPIVAKDESKTKALTQVKNLSDGIQTKGFRITEKKPYGTDRRENAINVLTYQNKSTDTIYIMSGDVVKGGRQDRMIAEDVIVPPRTLGDVAVFCVEPHRWEFHHNMVDSSTQENSNTVKKQFVFSGYYNVASSNIRRTVQNDYNQQDVWNKVGELTEVHNTETSTGTYAALESSEEFTSQRDAHINFLKTKMSLYDNAIGMIVVNGNEILGTDIFGNEHLFNIQYEALLHSYVTEAITEKNTAELSTDKLNRYVKSMQGQYESSLAKSSENDKVYTYQGELVHFSNF